MLARLIDKLRRWGHQPPATKRNQMMAAAHKDAKECRWHAVEHREAAHYQLALRQMYLQRIERLHEDELEESKEAAASDAWRWLEPGTGAGSTAAAARQKAFQATYGSGQLRHGQSGDCVEPAEDFSRQAGVQKG